MTKFRISPSTLSGTLSIPPSKSHTLRAILFGMLAKGETVVHNYLHSPDAIAMIEAIRLFGAEVKMSPKKLLITGIDGQINRIEDVVQSGNSGQVLRFIGALAALSPNYGVITGDHSIRHNRPVKPLLDALEQLGVFATSTRGDGKAPILIKGPLKGGKATLPGHDSQPISGLLIAASFAKGQTDIHVTDPGEKPWIDLTLAWFDFLRLKYHNRDYTHYTIPGQASIKAFNYTVPGDFSSAAFPIAAALITNSELTLKHLDMNDVQGDKKLIDALIQMGANIEIEKDQITIKKGSKLRGTTLDINDYIDAITILAVIGCYAEGETRLTNAAIARKKECDRIHAICTELKKMGARIEETEDGLIIQNSPLTGAELCTYNDHRMVMSLSVAALNAKGDSIIHNTDAAKKTYPLFLTHFQSLGANIEATE